MANYMFMAQIVVSLVLILVIVLQAKGSGFAGAFSTDSTVFRTRRGVEKLLFQFTIVLIVIFVAISLLSFKLAV